MSDKDIKEEINDEEQTEAAETAPSSPASELVDLVLSGELHAANEKFGGIVESKVVQSIEDEKLKIAQTLFNEADEEEEEGDDEGEEKPKKDEDEEVDEAKKVKEDDDEEEGDDSDDDDDDDSDDDDKKGEVPPQFKKEDAEPIDELSAKKLGQAAAAADKKQDDMRKARGAMPGDSGGSDAEKKARSQRNKFERGESDKANQEKIAKQRRIAAGQEEVQPEQSFDPGEATTNAPLPENSFVKQVSDYLAGNRK